MSEMTMQGVARLAGVSLATVSRTIKNPHLVRAKTRERVLRVMEEHNYVYHANAGDLSCKEEGVRSLKLTNSINEE